jgi:hypothetical protein
MFNPFSVLTSKIFAATTVAALTFAGVQTLRIEGFWFIKGYKAQHEADQKRISELLDAREKAAEDQKRLNNQRTADETQIARKTDEKQVITKYIIRNTSAQYAADNSLHEVCPSGTNPAAKVSSTEKLDRVSETSIVVSTRDFELLNTLAGKGIDFGNWGREMIAKGLAEEVKD